jgi:hypothetical protein
VPTIFITLFQTNMGPQEDNLFGRIALKQGYITMAQLEHCVKLQQLSPCSRLLGALLVEHGYMSPEQLRKVMILQKQTMSVPAKDEVERQADVSFGYIAVQCGMLTSEQVYKGVHEQVQLARKGLYFRLGEVFITRGFMTPEEVERVIQLQQQYLIACDNCGHRVNALRHEPSEKVACASCGAMMRMPARLPAL